MTNYLQNISGMLEIYSQLTNFKHYANQKISQEIFARIQKEG